MKTLLKAFSGHDIDVFKCVDEKEICSKDDVSELKERRAKRKDLTKEIVTSAAVQLKAVQK